MSQPSDPRPETADTEAATKRPVATFKQSGVEVTIWKNPAQKGDLYNTTIRNTYRDEKADAWKETANFSPADLAVLSLLSGQAFQEIVKLRQQDREKPSAGTAPARHAARHRSARSRANANQPT